MLFFSLCYCISKMKKIKFEILGELSVRLRVSKSLSRIMLNGFSSWTTQQSYCIRIDKKNVYSIITSQTQMWREENVDPLPSILKFFNSVIHISLKCFVRFSQLNFFQLQQSMFFLFIKHSYGMFKVFTEGLASYTQSSILSNSVSEWEFCSFIS